MIRGRVLLRVAATLDKTAGEASKRSVINRAYYAAFGEASEYAGRRGYTRAGGGPPHRRVWEFVAQIEDGDRRRRARRLAVSSHGQILQELREKADYRLGTTIGRDEPAEARRYAKRIIEELDQLTP
jgi:hypothetical protein